MNIELKKLNKKDSQILFHDQEGEISEVVVEGVSRGQMRRAFRDGKVGSISEAEKETLMNGQRLAIELEKGENGMVHGFDPKFHSLQYNDDKVFKLYSKVESLEDKMKVTLQKGGREKTQVASFEVNAKKEEYRPDHLPLYVNGRKVQVVDADYIYRGERHVVKQVEKMGIVHYRDTRAGDHATYGLSGGDIYILDGNKETDIFGDENVSKPLFLHRSGQIAENGKLTLNLQAQGEVFVVNYLDVVKDEIYLNTYGKPSDVEMVKLQDGKVGLILSEKDPAKKGQQEHSSYVLIEHLEGGIDQLKLVDPVAGKDRITLKEVSLAEVLNRPGEGGVFKKTQWAAEQVNQNLPKHFKDLEEPSTVKAVQEKIELQELPPQPISPIQSQSTGGRGH